MIHVPAKVFAANAWYITARVKNFPPVILQPQKKKLMTARLPILTGLKNEL